MSFFQPKTLAQLLNVTKVQNILPAREVIQLKSSVKVSEALRILSERRVLSAPVLDSENGKYLGFIDMFNLLCFVMKQYTEEGDGNVEFSQLSEYTMKLYEEVEELANPSTENKISSLQNCVSVWCHNMEKLKQRGSELGEKTIANCMEISNLDKLVSISMNANLHTALSLLKNGSHRIAVVNEKDEIINILSQSNILQFVASNIQNLGEKGEESLVSLKMGEKQVFSALFDTKAIDVFYRMFLLNVSAVAIVNNRGSIISNASVSDLRGLSEEHFHALSLPISEYLQSYVKDIRVPPITVKSSASLETAILKMAATKIHRLWIVNEKNFPVGVFSLTDLMSLLSNL